MQQIPPQLEALLRKQGVSDAQLDELRRTGSLTRPDTGEVVSLQHLATMAAGSQLTPEQIENLRRFRRFIPKSAMDQLERATGEDIDGDGLVGRGAGATPVGAGGTAGMPAASAPQMPPSPVPVPSPAARRDVTSVRRTASSSAMPTSSSPSNASGPFVQQSGSRSWIPWFVAFDVVAMIFAIWWFVLR